MEIIRKFFGQLTIPSDNESYYSEVLNGTTKNVIKQLMITALIVFVIGVIMGSYHSFLQALSSGIKMILLLMSVILICLPSYYVVQRVLGSQMRFIQILAIVNGGCRLSALVAISFTPIAVFFVAIGSRYHFIQLLYLSMFVFSGYWGLRIMIGMINHVLEEKSIYRNIGARIFKIWLVISIFVALQLSWNLRPFVAEKSEPFQILGQYKGNIYTAIIYSFGNLTEENNMEEDQIYSYPKFMDGAQDTNGIELD
jgi:hypothetical protein